MDWRPVEEIIPKEILVGHGGATSGPVMLTNGEDVWAGIIRLYRRAPNDFYISWDVHGVDGRDYEPEFDGATHYAPLPEPFVSKPNVGG